MNPLGQIHGIGVEIKSLEDKGPTRNKGVRIQKIL